MYGAICCRARHSCCCTIHLRLRCRKQYLHVSFVVFRTIRSLRSRHTFPSTAVPRLTLALLHSLGITGLFLLQNIIIADISSLRNRLFWSIFPSIPGVINVWISGNVTQSILGAANETASRWRWGMGELSFLPPFRYNFSFAHLRARSTLKGMFAIMTPVLTIPVMLTLGIGMRKSKKESGDIEQTSQRSLGDKVKSVFSKDQESHRPRRTLWQKTQSIFWQLDLFGLLLFVAGFGMILVTVTIANGKGSHWSDGHCM